MAFDPQTYKISFLIGDIVKGKLTRKQPLPDLTCEESEELREHLLYEISCLREHGEKEGGRKERQLLARYQETLDNDERRLGKGKERAREEGGARSAEVLNGRRQSKLSPSYSQNIFVFEDVSGMKMVLRLANVTNETLLKMTSYLSEQLIERHLEPPHGFPIQSPLITSGTDNAAESPVMVEPQLNREWSTQFERQNRHQGRPATPPNTFDIIDLDTPPETPQKAIPATPVRAQVPDASVPVEGPKSQILPLASSLLYLLAGIILGFFVQSWLTGYDWPLGLTEGVRSVRLQLTYLGRVYGNGAWGSFVRYLAALWDGFVNKAFLMMLSYGIIV